MEGKLAALLAGQDQDDLAARVAISPETARRWINGDALPYRRTLPAISVATGIDLDVLLRARRADRLARKAATGKATTV